MFLLLHSDSHSLYGRSVCRELTAACIKHWKISHPGTSVIEHELNATDLQPFNAEWFGQYHTAFFEPHLEAVQSQAQLSQGGQA